MQSTSQSSDNSVSCVKWQGVCENKIAHVESICVVLAFVINEPQNVTILLAHD